MEVGTDIEEPQVDSPDQSGDPAETYYNYLKKAGADVAPTLDSFKRTLADDKTAQQYYGYLKSNGFDAPPTYDSFSRTLGVKKNGGSVAPLNPDNFQQPKAASESTATPQPVISKDQGKPTLQAFADKHAQAQSLLHKELTGNNDLAPGLIHKMKSDAQASANMDVLSQQPRSDMPLTNAARAGLSMQTPQTPVQVSPDEINDFLQLAQNDPNAGRAFLQHVSQAKPEKAPAIQAAMYATDAANRISQEPGGEQKAGKILQNAHKIEKGDLTYSLQSGTLLKPEDAWQSIGTGLKAKSKAFADYDFFDKATPDQAIAELEKRRAETDPDEPTPVPKGFVGELAGGLASQPIKGLVAGKVAGAITGAIPGAEEFAPEVDKFITAAASSEDFRKMSYANSLQQNYYQLTKQGLDPKEAYAKAQDQAKKESIVDAASGAAMMYVGGKIGETPLPKFNLSEGFTKAVVNGLKQGAKGIGEAGAVGLIQGAATDIKNEMAAHNGIERSGSGDDIAESMKSGALFTLGMAAIAKGASLLSNKTRTEILQGLVKADPKQVDAELGKQIMEQHITPEEAVTAKKAIDEHRELDQAVPDNITQESRMKILDKINRRSELESSLEKVDKAYHPEIKEKIKAINEDILELSKDRVPRGTLDENKVQVPETEQLDAKNTDATQGVEQSPELAPGDVVTSPHFEGEQKIRKVSEDGKTVFMEGEKDHHVHEIPVEEVTKKGAAPVAEPGREIKPVSDKIQPTKDLRTWDLGDMEGKPEDEAAKKHIEGVVQAWDKHPAGETGGETFGQFVNRVIPAFKNILSGEDHNTTVITHSSVLKAFKVWDEMGRPDVEKLTAEQKKEFSTQYNKEETYNGDLETFKGDKGDIHVIRHGQTEDNAKNNFRSGNTNLTKKGIAQASEVGNQLGRQTGDDVPKIITSDLPRAIHTSNIIHDTLNPEDHASSLRKDQSGTIEKGVPVEGGKDTRGENLQRDTEPTSEHGKTPEPPGEGKVISTKNAVADQIREGNGLAPIEIPKDRGDDASLNAWKDGTRTPLEIVDQLLSDKDIYDKSITPNDEPIMREYIRGLENRGMELNKLNESLNEKVKAGDEKAIADQASVKQQLLNHYDEMQRALDAERIGGNIWHKYGQERQIAVNEKGQLINSISRIKTIYGDDMPEAVKKQLSDLQQKHDELVAKNQAIEERVKALEAENQLLKLDQRPKKGAKKTSQDFARERKDILSDMKDALKDIRKKGYSTVVPGAIELAAIAPHVLKLFKSFGEQGGIKLAEAIDKIHEIAKDALEGITKEQVKDIVYGKYTAAEKLKKEGEAIHRKMDRGPDRLTLPKRKWENDPEWIKNNREKANLQQKLRNMEQAAMDSKKSMYMRGLDWTNRWGRRVIFFGANAVYTKLASAAVVGAFVHRLPETLAGKINAKMFPHLAKGAPIEGDMNMAAEAKFYKEFLNPKKWAESIWSQAKSGETPLSKELGRHSNEKHIPIVDLFAADVHVMIKDPVKRATFEASVMNHLRYYANNSIDGTHPLMLESARQAAYKVAEYEIFQNSAKNAGGIGKFFKELEKSGIVNNSMPDTWNKVKGNAQYTAAALYHFFVPVNTVPTNILKRVGLGLVMPFKMAEAMSKNKAIKEGILNMSQEDSDLLMRQLKKGQIGAAYWTLGFILGGSAIGGLYTKYDPDRERGDNPKTDQMNFGDVNISKNVQHNTQLQSMQMGGTWKTVYNHYIDDKGASQMKAIAAGTAATAGAALESIPTIAEGAKIIDAAKTPYGGQKFVDDLVKRVGVTKASDILHLMGYGNDDDKSGGSGGGAGAGDNYKITEFK